MKRSIAAILVAACGCGGATSAPDAGPPDLAPSNALVAARPYETVIPSGYDGSRATPLVILLHGYGASGFIQDAYWGFTKYAEEKTFLYAYPDGTKDQDGKLFWNATDECCDLYNSGVDDVAYLGAVLDDLMVHYNVDKKRVFFIGHSNGGFMSHRLACDLAPRVAAIVSLAGASWKDVSRCQPSEPVAVLEIHGTADTDVPYVGAPPDLPSARDTVLGWVARDGCDAAPTTLAPIDLDTRLTGAETIVERYAGCHPGGDAELWTIQGGGHVPILPATWPSIVYTYLGAHPKP